MNAQRPLAVTIAAVLLALFSVLNLAFSILVGPAESDGPPTFIVYLAVALGIIGLAALAGLWAPKRWGAVLTVIVSVLNILAAAPGLFVAPTSGLQVSAIAFVVAFALIIVLVMLPTSRRAYA